MSTTDRRVGPQSAAAAARVCRHCRHCRDRHVTRPRGLCGRCHGDPAVRVRYAPAVQYGHAANAPGEDRTPVTPPPAPTEHRPGSPAKVGVLEARAAAGYTLWHPLDAPADG